MKMLGLVITALSVSVVPVAAQSAGAPLKMQGVWRVVSTTGAAVNPSSQPSLLIFTGKHYSILRVTSNQPRAAVVDPAKASTAQLVAMWGNQGFVANAGTYEVAGGVLTTHPIVAKNPDVMKAGTIIVYNVKMDGNALMLTESRDTDGPVASPTTLRLTRVE
jgi:hypothetical protein